MKQEERDKQRETYLLWLSDKQVIKNMIKEKIPYEQRDTLDLMEKMYRYLKQFHTDLPKLRKSSFGLVYKKCTLANGAHSHHSKFRICLSEQILKYRIAAYDIIGLHEWSILEDDLLLIELVTHEISHYGLKGCHNKTFYTRQIRYFVTLMDGCESGAFYMFK